MFIVLPLPVLLPPAPPYLASPRLAQPCPAPPRHRPGQAGSVNVMLEKDKPSQANPNQPKPTQPNPNPNPTPNPTQPNPNPGQTIGGSKNKPSGLQNKH
ncbi:hypothetical protein E2C01_071147 [Portunus trituberculatus]|uniref:Uncharacterized protein n=1 Tax=Portunus trituberculatus TaxID=210409 RepID=A0A5B7HUL6_PORTR|nr:hypothetical protein [Portunus trituberculatus]